MHHMAMLYSRTVHYEYVALANKTLRFARSYAVCC